jgi:hypothetical protein
MARSTAQRTFCSVAHQCPTRREFLSAMPLTVTAATEAHTVSGRRWALHDLVTMYTTWLNTEKILRFAHTVYICVWYDSNNT